MPPASASPKGARPLRGPDGSGTGLGTGTGTGGERVDGDGFGEEIMVVLSMGHRIHLLAYDPAQVHSPSPIHALSRPLPTLL